MKSLQLTTEAPIVRDVDVLVIGGGPSGIAAAVAAARGGAQTMLVETNGYLGGMATAGLVGPFMTSYSPDGSEQITKGIFEEFVGRLVRQGGAIHPSQCEAGSSYASYISRGHAHVGPFDSEVFKREAEALCVEAGVELLYHAMFVQAVMDGAKERITGAVLATKAGLLAINAKIFIDCTGDGDVAASAGVEMKQGREGDGLTQPCTLFFQVFNIDKQRLEQHRQDHPEPDSKQFSTEVERARANGDFPINREKLGMYESCTNGYWRVNTTRITNVDATDPFAVTQAEIEGRKQVQIVMNFLHKYIPGAEEACLADSAPQLGVRESRRIVGEYVLEADDLNNSRIFEDSIGLGGFAIDIHQPDGKSGRFELIKSGKAYSIPYRSLLPKTVDNLLVAGRCISATHEALGAVRVMPPCFVTGEAAGTAAALAVRENLPPRRVEYAKLRKALTDNQVMVG